MAVCAKTFMVCGFGVYKSSSSSIHCVVKKANARLRFRGLPIGSAVAQ